MTFLASLEFRRVSGLAADLAMGLLALGASVQAHTSMLTALEDLKLRTAGESHDMTAARASCSRASIGWGLAGSAAWLAFFADIIARLG